MISPYELIDYFFTMIIFGFWLGVFWSVFFHWVIPK